MLCLNVFVYAEPRSVRQEPRLPPYSFHNLTPASLHLSPNSHRIISFADPHSLTSLESYLFKNSGGRGYLLDSINGQFSLLISNHLLSFHTVAHSLAPFKSQPFIFKRFRTLSSKQLGRRRQGDEIARASALRRLGLQFLDSILVPLAFASIGGMFR